ncbi:DUF2797 domain-containing protein [Kitasatospora terrestris]|uniref:DUF2797 domain-containing protein n=1 Tax=Kitasatospora terrestris TaxID=258051 RepID=A0ABP9DFX3_9ACTN
MRVWTVTGLRWADGQAFLAAGDGRREHVRALSAGLRVGWRIGGPRRCVGVWSAGRQRPCPYGESVAAEAKNAQCPTCQSADRGLALARDQIFDDGRTYRLYLAWFGDGLRKVGLTAEERGTARLQEQAALAYAFVGRGRLPAVRRAELTVAQAGLARERIPSALKSAAWWSPGGEAERRAQIVALRAEVLRLLDGHGLRLLADDPVVDQVAMYGLTGGVPEAYGEVKALADGAVLAGALRPAIGGHLFVDPLDGGDGEGGGPLLLDSRLLTGWAVSAVPAQRCAGIEPVPRARPVAEAEQDSLF